jgi:hypothetical protein
MILSTSPGGALPVWHGGAADSPYKNIADLVAASKTGKGVFYSSRVSQQHTVHGTGQADRRQV